MLKTKRKIWIRESTEKGKNGTYGYFWQHKETDELIYVAEKKNMAVGKFHKDNSFAIDEVTLELAESRGVKRIVVHINSNDNRYATSLAKFFSEAAHRDYSSRGTGGKTGSYQRYLSLDEFVERVRLSVI